MTNGKIPLDAERHPVGPVSQCHRNHSKTFRPNKEMTGSWYCFIQQVISYGSLSRFPKPQTFFLKCGGWGQRSSSHNKVEIFSVASQSVELTGARSAVSQLYNISIKVICTTVAALKILFIVETSVYKSGIVRNHESG